MENLSSDITIPFSPEAPDIVSFSGDDGDFHYHVLSYSWKGGKPSLQLRRMISKGEFLVGDGYPFDLALDRSEISWRFSGAPYCIGRFVDGDYVPCPGSRKASEGYSQCWGCLTQDIPDPRCIFEPHCHTEPCGARFCQVPHVVYVTAFRGTFKIGMTQFKRIKERAMEQGADGVLPLIVLKDRFSARYFEGRISRTLGLPQVVRSNVKFRNLVMERDLFSIGKDLSYVKEDLIMFWDDISRDPHPKASVIDEPMVLDRGPILIDDYPLDEPMASRPKRFRGERVKGKVQGYKGSYMFYRQGSIWAYRLSEIPGKVLSTNEKL